MDFGRRSEHAIEVEEHGVKHRAASRAVRLARLDAQLSDGERKRVREASGGPDVNAS